MREREGEGRVGNVMELEDFRTICQVRGNISGWKI